MGRRGSLLIHSEIADNLQAGVGDARDSDQEMTDQGGDQDGRSTEPATSCQINTTDELGLMGGQFGHESAQASSSGSSQSTSDEVQKALSSLDLGEEGSS